VHAAAALALALVLAGARMGLGHGATGYRASSSKPAYSPIRRGGLPDTSARRRGSTRSSAEVGAALISAMGALHAGRRNEPIDTRGGPGRHKACSSAGPPPAGPTCSERAAGAGRPARTPADEGAAPSSAISVASVSNGSNPIRPHPTLEVKQPATRSIPRSTGAAR
jgi:hypothetical protein